MINPTNFTKVKGSGSLRHVRNVFAQAVLCLCTSGGKYCFDFVNLNSCELTAFSLVYLWADNNVESSELDPAETPLMFDGLLLLMLL